MLLPLPLRGWPAGPPVPQHPSTVGDIVSSCSWPSSLPGGRCLQLVAAKEALDAEPSPRPQGDRVPVRPGNLLCSDQAHQNSTCRRRLYEVMIVSEPRSSARMRRQRVDMQPAKRQMGLPQAGALGFPAVAALQSLCGLEDTLPCTGQVKSTSPVLRLASSSAGLRHASTMRNK